MGLRVYVAGPLSKGNVVGNVRRAIDVAQRLKDRGHFPFSPHLTTFSWYFLHYDKNTLDDSAWQAWNFSWLECCDVLVRLEGESVGSDREVEEARRLGVVVFFGLESFMNSELWTRETMEGQ